MSTEDDPRTTDPAARNDSGTTTAAEGSVSSDAGTEDVSTTTGTRFCATKGGRSVALCADFDDGDAASNPFKKVTPSPNGGTERLVDSDASAPHALLIEIPASATENFYATEAQVPLGLNTTIMIDADLRIDRVNAPGAYTHVLVVAFGPASEPRYEVTVNSAEFSLFAYRAPSDMTSASSGTPLPLGAWTHLKLLMSTANGTATLQFGTKSVELPQSQGITTNLRELHTGPNVWVGAGAFQTAVAYDNFVVNVSP